MPAPGRQAGQGFSSPSAGTESGPNMRDDTLGEGLSGIYAGEEVNLSLWLTSS